MKSVVLSVVFLLGTLEFCGCEFHQDSQRVTATAPTFGIGTLIAGDGNGVRGGPVAVGIVVAANRQFNGSWRYEAAFSTGVFEVDPNAVRAIGQIFWGDLCNYTYQAREARMKLHCSHCHPQTTLAPIPADPPEAMDKLRPTPAQRDPQPTLAPPQPETERNDNASAHEGLRT
jgi:hypothetical protein